MIILERFKQLEFENNNHCSDCGYKMGSGLESSCGADTLNCPVVNSIIDRMLIPLSTGESEAVAGDFVNWVLDNEGFEFPDGPGNFVRNNYDKLTGHLQNYIECMIENGGIRNNLE